MRLAAVAFEEEITHVDHKVTPEELLGFDLDEAQLDAALEAFEREMKDNAHPPTFAAWLEARCKTIPANDITPTDIEGMGDDDFPY